MKPGGYILLGLAVAVAVCLAFLLGRRIGRNDPGEPIEPKVDTLVIRDTIRVSEPRYVTRRVIDSVMVEVTDTMMVHDTIFVVLEREQVRWEDSLSVVYASGIKPQVDSVIHYVEQLVITKEIPVVKVKKTRWGIGIQVGGGIGKDGLTPYAGIGLSYNIFTW